jgi:hypothetical protein
MERTGPQGKSKKAKKVEIRKNTLQDMTDPQAEKYRSSSIHSRKGQIRNDT